MADKQETAESVNLRQVDARVGLPVAYDVALNNGLGAKHEGMKISAAGILNRVSGRLKFGAQEMLTHLNEMAERYYAGDIKAVDEFLQLYCLDDKRP